MDYYKSHVKDALKELKTSENGLTSAEAYERLKKYGYNEIEEKEKISSLKIFLSQFSSPIVWILIGAIIISVIIGEKIDAIIISIILVINAIVGFIQEYKAEKAIEALKKMASLKAIVIRDGKEKEIDAIELVPGDIIILQTGEKIPADGRIIELANLQTQEAALTGESLPIKKEDGVYKKDLGIGDRKNLIYSGTVITNGRGKALVTGTGMKTEIGKIAHLIQTTESEITPLQKQLKSLGKWLGILTLFVCTVVFAAGVIRSGSYDQKTVLEFFIVAVSLAVAAIPEGLPAVVTISLAIGIKRMIKKNALIRKLPSVETLGSTTVICTDKTGTLTHNEMTVKKIYVDDQVVDVAGSGYEPKGHFSHHSKTLPMLLKIGALNNDAHLEEKNGKWEIRGDPTEGALIVSAAKLGLDKELLETKRKRIDEIQFDSSRKRMTTVHESHGKRLCYVKGAPDLIVELCSHIHMDGKIRKITKHDITKILKINEDLANNALRVLGFAYKELKKADKKKDYEKKLIFVGLQGMIDPPRKDAKHAIAKCKSAGIKVIMITGDFKGTAVAIAKDLGITGRAIDGDELEKMDLDKDVLDIGVYARVNPEHKLRIVEALRKKGHIVAMTGDGVNDAPALKKADIGIAMGISGTDVAKEASDMILTDDNFASIVNAVEEGRGVYDNIRKFLAFLLSGNIGEVCVIFIAMLLGLPLPLIAVQILMINLVTDGLPATALSADPFEPGRMERKPRNPKEKIYMNLSPYLIYYPAIMIITTLSFFAFFVKGGNIPKAQTVAFLSIAMFELYQAFSCRSTIYTSFKVGIFKNMWLNLAVLSSLGIIIAIIYFPSLQGLFGTFPLSFAEFITIVLVSSIGSLYLEIHKMISSRRMES
ncbi:calcium-translocating P-type ATPase, SERCA-type [candidate division KSB1 bacterium]